MFEWLKKYWIVLMLVGFLIAILDSTLSTIMTCHPAPNQSGQAIQEQQENECTALRGPVLITLESIVGFLDEHGEAVAGAFTIVLAFFTAALWRSTDKLWEAGERQLAHLERVSERQAKDMQESIGAARDANVLTRDIFISEQRPWLRWSILPGGILKRNGPRLSIEINGTLQNIGRIPASNISYFGRLYVPPPKAAAIDFGQMYFMEHMRELQNSGGFSLATILPMEPMPMRFTPEGLEIVQLPDSFTIWLAFHARYMFAVGTAPNPRAIAEIGSIYMAQPISRVSLLFQKDQVTDAETNVSIVEFSGARLLT